MGLQYPSDAAVEIQIAQDLEELERFRRTYRCEGCSRTTGKPRTLPTWSRIKNFCDRCFEEVEWSYRVANAPAPGFWRRVLPDVVVGFATLALVLFVLLVLAPLAVGW